MSDPASHPIEATRLQLNLRILSIALYNFASYLAIGLPLAVLPGYVHDVMGFSAFWAGLVISIQYFATLLSRPHAGRYADLWGAKRVVMWGLGLSTLSGLCYLLAFSLLQTPVLSLTILCAGRLLLGCGQSFTGTGSTLWGVSSVGSLHIGRVISWNGVVTYGAMAIGAPLGVVIYQFGGIMILASVITSITLIALLLVLPRHAVRSASKGHPMPFRLVLQRVWRYGLLLAMGSAGFGVIATFITLFYQAQGWQGGAYALALFSVAFVGVRLVFPNVINRYGGLSVALVCFAIEALGLLMVWGAANPWMANVGALLTGAGFSLVFPAIGVVAVKAVPQQNQGSALATYTVFMDMALGITGPLAGLAMSYAGVSIPYLAGAVLAIAALGITLKMRQQQQSGQESKA